jgi:Domain of unknown function (DUF6265)
MILVKMKGILILVLLIAIQTHAQRNEGMKWLVGTWRINTSQGYLVERWQQINDSTLMGRSFFVKTANDSLLQETLELKLRKGEWSYISTVQGQNNNLPVVFKVIFTRGSEFISENSAHDFPQRIAYRRIKNQLFASIEGRKNGRYSKQNFDFTSD